VFNDVQIILPDNNLKLITPENKNDTLKMRYKSNKLDDMNQIKDKYPKYDLNESLAASD